MTWQEFRDRFEDHKAATTAQRTAEAYYTVLNRFEAGLREGGCRAGTVASYLGHIKHALRWAEEMGYMQRAPNFKIRVHETQPRGLTAEEFDRMYAAVPKVRDGNGYKPNDSAIWQRFLLGLGYSGLRIGELVRLSWDTSEKAHVDLSGKAPRIRFHHAGRQKASRRADVLPVTSEFAAMLLETPEHERTGPVFKLPCRSARRASRVVGEIRTAAKVRIDKPSQGMRRHWITTIARCKPRAEVQRLARHSSDKTTDAYYVDTDALEESLLSVPFAQVGNSLGNSAQELEPSEST